MVDMGSIAAIDATSLDTLFDLPAVIEKKCIGFRYWTLRQLNRQIKKAEIENRKMFEQHDDDERQVHLRRIQTHIDAIDALRERFRMELSKLQAGKFQVRLPCEDTLTCIASDRFCCSTRSYLSLHLSMYDLQS